VFDEKASVFDYQEASGLGFFCDACVGDSLLEPQRFGVDGYGRIGYRRHFLGTAEDVDDVDGNGDVFQSGIGFLAQDFGYVRIYRYDFVADGLEIGRHAVGGSEGIGGEADYGDGFGVSEQIGDGIGRFWRVVGEMKVHEVWMNVGNARLW
jgi:hypothetical protein